MAFVKSALVAAVSAAGGARGLTLAAGARRPQTWPGFDLSDAKGEHCGLSEATLYSLHRAIFEWEKLILARAEEDVQFAAQYQGRVFSPRSLLDTYMEEG